MDLKKCFVGIVALNIFILLIVLVVNRSDEGGSVKGQFLNRSRIFDIANSNSLRNRGSDTGSNDFVKREKQRRNHFPHPIFRAGNLSSPERKNFVKDAISKRGRYFQDTYEIFNLLRQFDLYQELNTSLHFNDDPKGKPLYGRFDMGLINDPNYCDIVDTYNILYPGNVLKTQNFLTDYNIEGLARKVFRNIGYDVMPDIVNQDMNQEYFKSRTWPIPINTTLIFTKRVRSYYYHKFGVNLFCLSQMYNHIPGHGTLTRQDLNIQGIKNYQKKFVNKPHCYKKHTFFPPSYRLDNDTECKDFFNIINQPNYTENQKQEGISYITKVSFASHRANGLQLLDDYYQMRLRRKYENGALCGEVMDNLLAQKYISNPDLIEGHQYDFRIYLLIASTDPLIIYYHDGFLRLSMLKFDKFSKDRTIHFANTNLAQEFFENAAYYMNLTGKNETELRKFQMRSMEEFQDYMVQIGRVQRGWLDSYLRPEFQRAFVHTVMMSEHGYLKDSRVFEIFGLDFMLDEDLNLWFIQSNASPVLQGTTEAKTQFQGGLIKDAMQIQYAYLRSRWSRVMKFVQKLQQAMGQGVVDFIKVQEEFKQINKNYLEPEFESQIKENNSFTKITDLNLQGQEAYGNLFAEDCFD